MKRLLLLSMLLIAYAHGFAQSNVNVQPMVIISNADMNIMYRGYDNRLVVSVPGVPDSKIMVSALEATVRKSGSQTMIEGQWYQADGNQFTDKQITAFRKLRSYYPVILRNIIAVGPGGQEIRLAPVVFFIK